MLDGFGDRSSELTAFAPNGLCMRYTIVGLQPYGESEWIYYKYPNICNSSALAPVTIVETGSPVSIVDLAFHMGFPYDASYLNSTTAVIFTGQPWTPRLHDAAKKKMWHIQRQMRTIDIRPIPCRCCSLTTIRRFFCLHPPACSTIFRHSSPPFIGSLPWDWNLFQSCY